MDEPSDAQLLASCLQGDQSAAQALVERFHPLVVRIARAHHPRHYAVDDLVQDVVLKMFARLHQYQPRPGIDFSHWLARLAVTTCLDAIRSEDRRERRESLSQDQQRVLSSLVDDHAAAVGDALGARELVERLLGSLPPRDALLVTLLDCEGLSLEDCARTTGWNRTLIKVRAFRARRRLRALAESLLGESRQEPLTRVAPSHPGARHVDL